MQHFKSRLTRIKSLIDLKLPDGPDIYGYSGVDKAMLLHTCGDIYALAELIEAKDGSQEFEIIVLKRFESKIHDALKKFLEEDAGKGREKDKFDEFLDRFSRLYEKTKQVYFIVSKDGLRDELEIQALRDQLTALQAKKAEYETLIDGLKAQSEAAAIRTSEIETALKGASEAIKQQTVESTTAKTEILNDLGHVKTWHQEISDTHGKMAGWDKAIEETLQGTKTNEAAVGVLLGQLQTGATDLAQATEKSSALTVETNLVHGQNQELIKEIQNTLGDSNRVGMAASFKEQMTMMAATQKQWKWTFIVTLIAFAVVSISIIAVHMLDGAVTWQSILARLAMVTPLIWLAWFAVRQYGFANRVREDYAYKYASAMAFEGYKKAVREADPALEKALVEVAIMNMAQNPVRLYNPKDSDHASPLSELFDKIFGRVKGAKANVNQAGISVEADMSPDKTKL